MVSHYWFGCMLVLLHNNINNTFRILSFPKKERDYAMPGSFSVLYNVGGDSGYTLQVLLNVSVYSKCRNNITSYRVRHGLHHASTRKRSTRMRASHSRYCSIDPKLALRLSTCSSVMSDKIRVLGLQCSV